MHKLASLDAVGRLSVRRFGEFASLRWSCRPETSVNYEQEFKESVPKEHGGPNDRNRSK